MPYVFNPFTGTFDWTAASAGGSPAGSTTQVQFNDAGSFGGAAQIAYDKAQGFTGFQNTTPLAPVHAIGSFGTQIPAPASITATLSEDVPVTTPTSGSAIIQYGPSTPSTPTVTLTQIDYVTSASTSQSTGSGSYIANGQTIYYRIYCYRTVSGVNVVHPTYYSTSFTDSINDGSTQFTVDITGISTNYSNIDGYIIVKSYDSYTWSYSVDIGTSTSYNDNDFTGSVSFEATAYVENGGNWSGYVAQYSNINGTNYRSDYVNNYATDSNTGQGLILLVNAWGTLSYDGFIIQQHNGIYIDIGTNTSYYDWGGTAGSIGDMSAFTTIAFPILNTSLTGSTSTTASFNYGTGTYTAFGYSWDIEVWEYRTHPESGIKYFVSTPDTYSLGADDSSSNSFDIAWSTTPGDGTGRYIVVYQNSSAVYEQDVASATSGNISGFGSVSSKTPISSYTGITRNFTLYGKVTSPTTKYSNSGYTYSFSDSNVAPYLIIHTWPSPGNATNFKVLESSYRSGSIYDTSAVATYVQSLYGIGDSTVTPSSIGYLANGSNLNRTYSVYSFKTIYGTGVYSPTFASTTTTDPNNGKYYVVDLSWSGVSGASYKLKRTIGATSVYYTTAITFYSDSTSSPWSDSSTLTPIYGPVTSAIVQRACTNLSNPPTLSIRNSNASFLNLCVFDYVSGGNIYEAGRFGINNSGYFFVNTPSQTLTIGTDNSPHTVISLNTVFNNNNSAGGSLRMKGSTTPYLMYAEGATDTVYFGASGSIYGDPQATIYVQPYSSGDQGIVIAPTYFSSSNNYALVVKNTYGTTLTNITYDGRVSIFSTPNNGNLNIGSATYTNAQIRLESSYVVPSVSGGITYYGGKYYGGNTAGTMRQFYQTPNTYTSGSWLRVDSTGDVVADNRLNWNGSYIAASVQMLFQAGIALSSSQNIVMGSGSAIQGGILLNYSAKSANYTLTGNDYAINVTASGKTITLPTAASKTGQIYVIKATHTTGTTTLNTTSSQTIFTTSAVTTITMNAGDCVRVMSNGSNWIAI